MATAIKFIICVFVLIGIAFSFYGIRGILGSVSIVNKSTERAKGVFTGYIAGDASSDMSYAQFEFTSKDGEKHQVTESRHQIFEWLKPGQEIEVIVSPYGDHRIAGFFSLYGLDICILIVGLCFVFIPLLFWNVAGPTLKGPEGIELNNYFRGWFKEVLASKMGPITVGSYLKGIGVFVLIFAAVIIIVSAAPYIRQLYPGFGSGLIDSLEHGRFDEARELILKRKGINKINKYDQSPLILALEADQYDLARLLIEAGADVNIKSKMNKTPLLLAAQAGDLEIVKLLLAKGASPDAPEDEYPPVFYALAEKHYDISSVLIESGCDLKRVYFDGQDRYTVGDFTVLAQKPELTELVRRLGGSFTTSAGATDTGSGQSGEGTSPGLIESFTLDQARPYREFYDGRLKVELVSTSVEQYGKNVVVRISSDSRKAEYQTDYEDYSFFELNDSNGSPAKEYPFKCMEGEIRYEKSSSGSVTLSLYESDIKIDSGSYRFTVNLLKNWKYFIMFLGYVALAIALYYYGPLLWGFISIQIQARSHALATGFESYPVILYIIKTIPLLICFYLFFYLFFSYGWKGVVAAALMGISLQFYFNWHNRNQLISYAEKKHLFPVEGTKNRSFTGMVNEMPVTLSVGGIFIQNANSSDQSSGSDHTFLSFIVIQVSLNNSGWKDLVLDRDKEKKWGWDSSRDLERCQGAESALTAISKLPKYSIGRIEVIDGKLSTVKVFAPDSPAEIHLLTDLMVDLARTLN